MCGIAGIITRDGSPPSHQALEAMRDALAHRGPDGADILIRKTVGLVHTRLSIIDVEGGDQPLFSEDDSALVGNGEIYNYIELRAEQEASVRHRTRSDFEPALVLFDRQGASAIEAFRGMYAVAVLLGRDGAVILARDPFGIKPLYIVETAGFLAFASEPRALFAAGLAEPELIPEARDELLQLNYMTATTTPFEGIRRLPSGTALTIEGGLEAGRACLACVPPVGDAPPRDLDEAVAGFDRVFEDSVRVHQRSDVPYGMFLSGGIDSAALLAMMARLNDEPVRTFTCGFSGTGVQDERATARRVAEAYGAEHTEVEFSEEDFFSLLPAIVDAYDDPTIDYAILPTYKLAAEARKSVKVVLSGEGGDEIFGGYGRYRYLVRPWWRGGKKPRTKGTFAGLGVLRRDDHAWALTADALRAACAREYRDPLQAAQMTDIRGWLPADLLLKLDRSLMAHGVEGRTPYLDPAVAAFGFHLPTRFKVARNLGKWTVRHWLDRHCPVAEAFAPKKGFTVPVEEWIAGRASDLGPLVARQPAVEAVARPEKVADLFRAGPGRRGRAAWALLFFAVWHKRHIERVPLMDDVLDYLRS